MTTVKEFKKWLNRFPDNTEIEIAVQEESSMYQSYGPVSFVALDLEDNDNGNGWEFMDFRNNQFVKETEPHYKKVYLRIGESN